MKKYLIVLVFVCIVVVVYLLSSKTTSSALSVIQREINSKVDVVYKTGENNEVVFSLPDEDGILVLSPPYANIGDLGNDVFSRELKDKMQSIINSQETGHLFYIKRGHISDHRLLSGLVEPILGVGSAREIIFLLSRKAISGRPVTIEIEK